MRLVGRGRPDGRIPSPEKECAMVSLVGVLARARKKRIGIEVCLLLSPRLFDWLRDSLPPGNINRGQRMVRTVWQTQEF